MVTKILLITAGLTMMASFVAATDGRRKLPMVLFLASLVIAMAACLWAI
jgi:hypothetical protein